MKIAKGYKLFEMRDDGKLFPLFIGKNEETVMNEWVIADRIKVTKIISEEERLYILKEENYDEMEAFEPYRPALARRMKTA